LETITSDAEESKPVIAPKEVAKEPVAGKYLNSKVVEKLNQ
jgi:hypothetical protein